MKNLIIFSIIVVVHLKIIASPTEILKKGNASLAKKEFQAALDMYLQVEKSNLGGAGLYENMALASAGLQKDSKAILYLEKARKYSPNQASINNNLALILKRNSQIDSNTTELEITKISHKLIGLFSIKVWLLLSLITLFGIGLISILYYPYEHIESKIRFLFVGLVAVLFICSIAGFFRHEMIYNNTGIIITKENTILKLGPDDVSPEVTSLPSGTKVFYHDHINGWWQVKTGYGEVGWINVTNGEKI